MVGNCREGTQKEEKTQLYTKLTFLITQNPVLPRFSSLLLSSQWHCCTRHVNNTSGSGVTSDPTVWPQSQCPKYQQLTTRAAGTRTPFANESAPIWTHAPSVPPSLPLHYLTAWFHFLFLFFQPMPSPSFEKPGPRQLPRRVPPPPPGVPPGVPGVVTASHSSVAFFCVQVFQFVEFPPQG